jgi:hypothetical protein
MTRQGYGTSIPELLRRAVEVGTPQARMELGVAVMTKKAGQREKGGSWYGAVAIDESRPPGQRPRYRLFGEAVSDDGVKRDLVDTFGEAQEFDTYRDVLAACAIQGEGAPMHEREALRVMPGAAVLTIGKEGIER